MSRLVRIAHILIPTALAVWVAVLPALMLPDAVPGLDAVDHASHVCGTACASACRSTPPDVCCGSGAGGCGGDRRDDCAAAGLCRCCAQTGSAPLFLAPAPDPSVCTACSRLVGAPDPASPVNLFQPPTPPPRPV